MLSEVFCTIDTREQNRKRIQAVTEFIEGHNGAVEHAKLDLCDYRIQGNFREKEIDIGIEAKSLTDFSGSYQDLPDKLARSFELYTDVCLFVEIPQFRTSSEDGFHAFIKNDAVTDGTADVLQYAVLQNSLASWQQAGVHIRQLQSELMWPYSIASVLISITKDTHRGLEITKTKDFKSLYLNIISKIEIEQKEGFRHIGYKNAQKVIKSFPNLYWLCTYSEEDLKDALGKVTGKKLFDFVHNNSLITSEWENKGCKSQLSKETEKSLKSNPKQSIAKPDISDDYLKVLEKEELIIKQIKPFILGFLRQNPAGLSYKDIERTVNEKFNVCGLSDEAIKELMNDGDCYEPRVGFIVPTEETSKCIEVPKGCYVNGGEIRDINPERDQEIETLQSSSAPAVKSKHLPTYGVPGTPDNSQSSSSTRNGEEKLGTRTTSERQLVTYRPTREAITGKQEPHSTRHAAPDNLGENALSLDSQSSVGNNIGMGNNNPPDFSNNDQPKAISNLSPNHNPPPSAASSICEPPYNSEFSANPRMKDIIEFIRKHPRTTDEVDREFGLSKEYCFKALNELWHKKKIWFNKSALQWEFGIDKNPAPVVADKDIDLGV